MSNAEKVIYRREFPKEKESRYKGDYIEDANDCHWDSLESFIQGRILGFCCCGDPKSNIEFVGGFIEVVKNRDNYPSYDIYKKTLLEAAEGSHRVIDYIFYSLEIVGLLEHGSSIGGSWLSEKGEQFLLLYNEFKKQK